MIKKNFLTKVVLATVLTGGISLMPIPNFDTSNIQISVAYAENKNFAAKEAAMTDVELIEAQAKEASRLRAIEAVKEKIASYIRNFSGAKGKLNEDDIAAIAEKFEQVRETKYQKLFYNAVDEDGKELGKVGIMYEATVTAKFNSKKITEHIKLNAKEKEKRIRQAREARARFEELDREYEELRKNARTKTPEQLQSDIKKFDDKIADLEKSRNKNKSANKKSNIETKKNKIETNLSMKFSGLVEIGSFGWYNDNIVGGHYVMYTFSPQGIGHSDYIAYRNDYDGWYYLTDVELNQNKQNLYEDDLILHYRMRSDPIKLGSFDIKNKVSFMPTTKSTTVFKVKTISGYTMYFLRKDYWQKTFSKRRYHYVLIGHRPDGKWVKYFDTEDLCKQYIGEDSNISIQEIISNGDTLIAIYARCNHSPYDKNFDVLNADELGEIRFKWDESAKWFGVEKIIYSQSMANAKMREIKQYIQEKSESEKAKSNKTPPGKEVKIIIE